MEPSQLVPEESLLPWGRASKPAQKCPPWPQGKESGGARLFGLDAGHSTWVLQQQPQVE